MKTLCKISELSLTFVSLIILYACDPGPTPTYLLRATFDSDVLDGHPDKTLPGDPLGDELVYDRGMAMSIVPTHYAPTHKSLDFRGGGSIAFVGKSSSFVGIPTFKWAGTVINHWGGPPQLLGWEEIQISDGYDHLIARLVIFGSTLYVKQKDSDPNNPTSGQSIYGFVGGGWDTPDHHIIEVKTSLSSDLFDLQLVIDGKVLLFEDIPVYETDNLSVYSTSPRPTITFTSGSANSTDGYILDDVFITRLVFVMP